MKVVEINNGNGNTTTGFCFGMLGGIVKFILSIPSAFLQNLIEAACIGVVSGACGVAGKEIYAAIKRRFKK